MSPIAQIVSNLFHLFNFLLLIWCLCSWFPNINWHDQPFKALNAIVNPVIAPFRKIVPTIGNIDVSPVVAIVCLQFVSELIIRFL